MTSPGENDGLPGDPPRRDHPPHRRRARDARRDLLAVPGDDLSALALTAAPGPADEARLAEVVEAAGGPAVVRLAQPPLG